jgi:EmrB/QacA subfamily drug resistance transporter
MSEADYALTRPTRRFVTHPDAARWLALPILLAGTFMIVLDFFIVNVALPALSGDLRASATAVEWVVAGYGLTLAAFLITAGRLGDRVGRRRLFMLGLALFTVASAACGAAPDANALVAARLVQGVAAALISPSVLALIGVLYNGADRPRALSAYGLTLGFAAVGGQLIGGALIQANLLGLGWRAVFLINVPVGLLALAFAPRMVPESRARSATRIDLVGTVLVTAALVALVLPLVDGRELGWPVWTWACLAGAPLLLAAFAAQQRALRRRGGAPLLDPALFRERAVRAGLATQLVFWCGQASFFLVLALYLQQGRGLDALQAGAVFTILAVAYLGTSLRAPALTARLGRRLIAVAALTLAAGHALLLASVAVVGTGGSIVALVPGLVLAGAGKGLAITPLTATVMAGADAEHAGALSGVFSTTQQVGNALGVAVTGVIFFGALHSGFAPAFERSLAEIAGLLLVVAAMTRLLPRAR